MDALGIDVVVTASQKGWLAPPGLTMIAVSDAAMAVAAGSACPSWYFDFQRQRAAAAHGRMHSTPPVSVMYALQEGIAMLREEGREAVWQRHAHVARVLREGLRDAGLTALAAPRCASSTVTVVRSPYPSAAGLGLERRPGEQGPQRQYHLAEPLTLATDVLRTAAPGAHAGLGVEAGAQVDHRAFLAGEAEKPIWMDHPLEEPGMVPDGIGPDEKE